MRAVTRMAGTSVSAAHYHFGSKEDLLREALRRRSEPLNARRLEYLARAEATPREGSAQAKAILEAFILPLFELRPEVGSGDNPQRNLAARLYVDPPQVVKDIREEVFSAMTVRFRQALQSAIAGADPERVDLALQLSLGVVVHSISGRLAWPGEAADPSGSKRKYLVENLVSFAAAGLLAVVHGDAEASASAGRTSP
jgi:AcrR family transcriptional regulator